MKFSDLANISQIEIAPREDNVGDWEQVLNQTNYVKIENSRSWIDYQNLFLASANEKYLDLSHVIYQNKRPVGLWSFGVNLDSRQLTTCGLKLEPPVFIDGISQKSRNKLASQCLSNLTNLSNELGCMSVRAVDYPEADGSIGFWMNTTRKSSSIVSVSYQMYSDTTLDLPQLLSKFRDTTRHSINKALQSWDAEVFDGQNPDLSKVWTEFKMLHIRESGRQTRSDETWEIQEQSIKNDDGFFIGLFDENRILVGGGYFMKTRSEVLYAVAAYNRDLFNQSIGHAVQYLALSETIRQGIPRYRVGELRYENEIPKPTDKELSISKFKQQFSTQIRPIYNFEIQICNLELNG